MERQIAFAYRVGYKGHPESEWDWRVVGREWSRIVQMGNVKTSGSLGIKGVACYHTKKIIMIEDMFHFTTVTDIQVDVYCYESCPGGRI